MTDKVATESDIAARCAIMRRVMADVGPAPAVVTAGHSAKIGQPKQASKPSHDEERRRADLARVEQHQRRQQEAAQRQDAPKEPSGTTATPPSPPLPPPPPLTPASSAKGHGDPMDLAAEVARGYDGMGLHELYTVRMCQAPPASVPTTPQTFEMLENVKGKRINTLSGLALYTDVLSPAEQHLTLQ